MLVHACRYELMLKTWSEKPEERPTFCKIVNQLGEMTGRRQGKVTEESTYFAVEGLLESGSHESRPGEDMGGVHVYTDVESPVYKNFSLRPGTIVPYAVPEEYEIPVKTGPPSSNGGDLASPMEYEIPVSGLLRSGDQKQLSNSYSSRSSANSKQEMQWSGRRHVYHTLEQPDRK